MSEGVTLAGRLHLPRGIEAVIFDVDGVVLDTLGADHDLCVEAATAVIGEGDWVPRPLVAKYFAFEPATFWRKITADCGRDFDEATIDRLVTRYEELRAATTFAVLPGIEAILDDATTKGVRLAVASSNDNAVLNTILTTAGVIGRFEALSGLGEAGVAPKPAPDLYVRAATALGLDPKVCAFIEDSLTGLQAGKDAGLGHAIAVATGPASFATLAASGLADAVYDRFETPRLTLIPNTPAKKTLDTPNDFVSHMVEHIAWRIGSGIDLAWRNGDWRGLGRSIGETIKADGFAKESAATLGMIDDGAAEVLIDRAAPPGVDFDTHASLPRDAVLAMRVEQVASGDELVALMGGLAEGLEAQITVRMCTFEDPHHSWEGVFRAIGICLSRLRSGA